MDILKIRKKKQQEEAARKAEATPSPSPSSLASTPPSTPPAPAPAPAPAAASTPPPTPTPAPPPAASQPPAASPPAPARPAADEPSRKPARATKAHAKMPEAVPPLIVDDPLLEFLARYDEGADQMIVAASPEAPRDESKRYLAFELAGEEYAASIMEIREILRVLALTAVPRAPREILGVLSKRGLVMPVVDLAASLGLREPERAWSPRQRILVVGEGDRVCGLRVDRVLEVVRLSTADVEEVPASLGSRSRHQLRGLGRVGDRMFILLDVPAVLHAMAVAAGLEAREEVA